MPFSIPLLKIKYHFPLLLKYHPKLTGPSIIWPLHTCVAFVTYQVSYARTTFPRIPSAAHPRCARLMERVCWRFRRRKQNSSLLNSKCRVPGSDWSVYASFFCFLEHVMHLHFLAFMCAPSPGCSASISALTLLFFPQDSVLFSHGTKYFCFIALNGLWGLFQ